MKTPALLSILFVLVLAAGCASVVWEKPGTDSAQLLDDTAACQHAAATTVLETQDWIGGSPTLTLPVSELDHRAFGSCMRERGYAGRVQP